MHTETVLFVDHHQTERGEIHFVLEQCMGADGNRGGTAAQLQRPRAWLRALPATPHTVTPSGVSQRSKLWRCCSASNSVGAMTTA